MFKLSAASHFLVRQLGSRKISCGLALTLEDCFWQGPGRHKSLWASTQTAEDFLEFFKASSIPTGTSALARTLEDPL